MEHRDSQWDERYVGEQHVELLADGHDAVADGVEGDEEDDGTGDVEDEVCAGGTLAGGAGGHGHHLCRQRGAEVLADDQCHRRGEVYPSLAGHQQDDCRHGRRGLEDDAEDGAHDDEEQHGPVAPLSQGGDAVGHVLVQRRHGVAHEAEAEDEQRQAHDGLAEVLHLILLAEDEEEADGGDNHRHQRHLVGAVAALRRSPRSSRWWPSSSG